MPWLIAFLVAHSIEIAAIGIAASTISSVGSAVVTSVEVVKVIKDEKKEEK